MSQWARLGVAVMGLLSAAACATTREAPQPVFEVHVEDEPANRLFRITLRSLTDAPFCIQQEDWTNSLGEAYSGSLITLVWDGGEKSAIGDFSEYCIPSCVRIVPARGSLAGFVRYEEFGDAEWVSSLAGRTLRVPISTTPCRRRDLRTLYEAKGASRDVTRIWSKHRAALERFADGRKTNADEVEQACLFFERLTTAPCEVDWGTLGPYPSARTAPYLKDLDAWFEKNSAKLRWDDAGGTPILTR